MGEREVFGQKIEFYFELLDLKIGVVCDLASMFLNAETSCAHLYSFQFSPE